MRRSPLVVIATPGLDGHDRAAEVVARALRDAGCEVIAAGRLARALDDREARLAS